MQQNNQEHTVNAGFIRKGEKVEKKRYCLRNQEWNGTKIVNKKSKKMDFESVTLGLEYLSIR
jgi:hypothetical protein